MSHVHLLNVLFGFLAAYFAHTAASIHRVQIVKAGHFSKALGSSVSALVCYSLAIFSIATFVGIDFDLLPESRTFSLFGILFAIILSVFLFAACIAVLTRIQCNILAFRLTYFIMGAVAMVSSHIGFMVFPQFNLIERVNWLGIVFVFCVTATILWFQASVLVRTLYTEYIRPLDRMIYSLILVTINLGVVFGLLGCFEFTADPNPMNHRWLPLKSDHYFFLVCMLGITLIVFVVYGFYSKMYDQITQLQRFSQDLESQNQGFLDEVQRANFQVEVDAERIRSLEATLHEGEKKAEIPVDSLVSAVLSLQDGIFDWDLQNDELNISHTWRNLLGLSDQEVRVAFSTWKRGFIEADLVELDEAVDGLVNDRAKVVKFQMRYEPPEGGLLKIEFRMAAVKNAYGLVSKLVGLMEDRTAEMMVEMDVRDNLSEEHKLSSRKSEFVTYLSHQIRTPMTVISSSTALLDAAIRYESLDEERVCKHIDQVEYALGLLRSLVDESLIFIGSDTLLSGFKEDDEVDVNSLLDEVLTVEAKRRSQSLPENFKIQRQIPQGYRVQTSEVMLANVFRQFVSFVFDNPRDARGMFVYSEKNKLFLQVLYSSVPSWVYFKEPKRANPVEQPSLYEMGAQILPIDEEHLPFALLLSKRVIRTLKGRLILRNMAGQLSMTVEVPLSEKE